MSVSVDIVPLGSSLDMYGEPRSSSAFSLSGHVSISLSSPYYVFERRRAARILLQSISLTFDGQTEVVTNGMGYSSIRLCSITRELLPSGPIELSNEGEEEDEEPCRWNVIFDLPIPGWLPVSSNFCPGEVGASTRYFLHASVKYTVLEDAKPSAWSIASLYTPFRSRCRTLETAKSIILRRFVTPPTDEPVPAPTLINYLLNSPSAPSNNQELTIPASVLSKIQLLASVPKYVDLSTNRLPFTLRLRTKDLEDEHCRRLRLTKFTVNVVQEERCRRVNSPSQFQSAYPVPSAEMQPPTVPLLDASPMCDMYKLGLYTSPPGDVTSMTCLTSLLPASESGVFQLTSDPRVFAEDAVKDTATWYTLETSIPFVRYVESTATTSEWDGSHKLRPSSSSPLYDVTHSLKLQLHLEYDTAQGQVASADIKFNIPVTFGRVAPPLPPRDLLPMLINSIRIVEGTYPEIPALLPSMNLPVYSQLFDTHGNRKMDDTPLPLYSPRSLEQPAVEICLSDIGSDKKHVTTI
ncbi:unnamed protein product [Mycena citricolor]|uniref:Uncharacterized protein n=1 Tax=Mycena citricolor TaxID=2018698 RepID=A0AAD2HM62_9AGAR|nr:unnamed protein product [Mycena citricolor]